MTNGEWLEKFTKTEAKEWIKCAAKACLGGSLVGAGIALIANNCYEAGKKMCLWPSAMLLRTTRAFQVRTTTKPLIRGF